MIDHMANRNGASLIGPHFVTVQMESVDFEIGNRTRNVWCRVFDSASVRS